MKKSIIMSALVGSMVVGLIACKESFVDESPLQRTSASAKEGVSSLTGQGIMAEINATDVVITEGTVYLFDKAAAKAYYTTSAPYGLVITSGSGAAPAIPTAPAPDDISNGVVNGDRCIFYNGGDLPDYTYKKTINGTKGWKWTWTYAVTGAVVAPKTAWNEKTTAPGVDPEVPIDVNIAGLSVLSSKQHPNKYSFSLLDDLGNIRITDVKITVDGVEYLPGQTLVSGTDFIYNSNAGTFGETYLLNGTNGQWASTLLLTDSFAGNDAPNNILYSKIDQINPTLGVGDHTITVTATVKGNNGIASSIIKVSKKLVIGGGCN